VEGQGGLEPRASQHVLLLEDAAVELGLYISPGLWQLLILEEGDQRQTGRRTEDGVGDEGRPLERSPAPGLSSGASDPIASLAAQELCGIVRFLLVPSSFLSSLLSFSSSSFLAASSPPKSTCDGSIGVDQ